MLKLLCLLSATDSGIKQSVLQQMVSDLIQVYGFHNLIPIDKMIEDKVLQYKLKSEKNLF